MKNSTDSWNDTPKRNSMSFPVEAIIIGWLKNATIGYSTVWGK
jgi:hypothetical protein